MPYSTYIPKFSADLKSLQHLTSLRILDLNCARIEELPNEVGNLILLRHLDLSHTSLQKLPETVSNLRNLQTLILYGCLLRELPKGLGKLVNLRHLENKCIFKLECLPPGIGRLNSSSSIIQVYYPVALMGLDGAVRDGGGPGTLVFPKLRKLRMTEDSLRELSITDCPVLRITCIPKLLETLNLYGDSGLLSRSLPFIANHNLLLNSLYIDNSPHLTLPQGLAQLTELMTIHISHSKSLVCMSEELKQLTLLELLFIEDCPILASRCKKEVGEDWPIISHISVIQIDDNMIHGGVCKLQVSLFTMTTEIDQVTWTEAKVIKCSWKKPAANNLMLNSDGSLSNLGGVGAILRDSEGTSHGVCEGKVVPKTITVHELETLDWGWTWLLGLIGEELTW
ncbi:hypothetical protein GIB67_015156 [Kingdonia uniflora]|uniref:Disease resistance R13L4/SHOC-2-like LRR domain-containing protein n=1 Tax=Kingdonia uniflora TaxID=39325 RepID=A0A7J7LJH0_9MAGN|nr:hypothetical protein GIB67_015156 [Kingdonia uniflora]